MTSIQQNQRTLAFVVDDIPDFESVCHALRKEHEVVVLSAAGNALEQMTAHVHEHPRNSWSTIHILSHGAAGEIRLGSLSLSLSTLEKQLPSLCRIGEALVEDGDLYFYGCEIAKNSAGRKLIAAIAECTGANVAASENLTGCALMGADWKLDFIVGQPHSAPIEVVCSGILAVAQVLAFPSTSIWVRPGETSYTWTWGLAEGTIPISKITFYNVPAFGWNLDYGRFEYSNNDGQNWTTFTVNTDGEYMSVAGTVWRFVSTRVPAGSEPSNQADTVGHGYQHAGGNSGTSFNIFEDGAPTGINSSTEKLVTDTPEDGLVATLTPVDTGRTNLGKWVLESQSTPGLFALNFNPASINTAQLTLEDPAKISAIGSQQTITVRYFDIYQLDTSGQPIAGQGYSKTITFDVVGASTDLNFSSDIVVSAAADDQLSPAIASWANGDFVVTWMTLGGGILAQKYNGQGVAQGSQLTIDSTSTSAVPVVTTLENGGFAVAYADSATKDISVRIVASDGLVGPQQKIVTNVWDEYSSVAIAANTSGSQFVVSWHALDYTTIHTTTFNSSGVVGSADVIEDLGYAPATAILSNGAQVIAASQGIYISDQGVKTSPAGETGYAPGLAALSNGGFVLAWVGQQHAYAQIFDNSGNSTSAIFQADTALSDVDNVKVAALSDGSFVITWDSENTDGNGSAISGRRFDAAGSAVDATEFQINEQRYGDQSAGVVAALDAGKFAAVWVDSAASGKTTGSDIEMRVLLSAVPNEAPVIDAINPITVIDTATQDTLPNTAGTLSATDTDGIAGFGIQSGSTGGSTNIDGVVYDVSKAGTYGTLYVASTGVNQGKYVFVPNSAAVDALLSGSATDTFTVTATDSNARAATGSTTLTVNVTGANDAPTNISLSGNTVAENSGSGALRSVGTLTTTDVDMGDSFTYSFAGGADDSLFQIVGNELRFQDTTTLNFEAKSSYSITLKTTDAGGLTFDKTLSVLLTDVNEAPVVAVPLAAQSAAAGLSYSYTVPAGSFTDPDSGQTNTLVYSAALADNGALPSWLHFDPATRTFSGTPTSEDVGTPSVRVTASDGGGLSAYSDFTLSVVNGPSVNSIMRADSATALTNAASLTFTITFSESVIGVTNDDFIITGSATGGSVGTPSSSDGGVTWTVQVTGAGEGTLRLDLKSSGTDIQSASNSAAIVSGYTAGASYLVDRTPPPTPVINTAALTNQALPTLSGTAETNATVTVVVGGATYTTTATGGAWSINLASTSPDPGSDSLALNVNGSNLVSVIATDAAGNPSTSPATQMLVIDTTPPAAPAVTSPALTNQELPTLAGTGEVGATITVVVGTNNAIYTTVANGSGAWSVNLATAVPTSGTLVLNSDGTNSVTVTARDAANNPSQGTLHTLTIDTTPPAQTFSLPLFSNDKGSSDTDFITNTAAQVISATLSTGLGNGDLVWGSLDNGATWTDITAKVVGTTLTWDNATLTGSGTLKLKVTDAAGNDGSVLSQAYVLDTVAPAIEAGTVSLDGDSGSIATDFITNNGSNQTLRGTLSGNLSADEIVEVSLDNGTTWTTATALPGTNSWSLSGVTLVGSGTLQVRVSDTAGNSSTALSQAYTVDTAAPVFDPATSSPGDNATGVGISSAVVLRFGEPLASVDTAKVYLRDVATQTLVAAAVTLNADGALVITPNAKLASLTDYYVSWDADALKDVAGNAVEVVDNATTFNFKTELITPPTPVDPAPPTGPVVVDGVAVTTVTQADGSTRISIPIVQSDRQENVGAGSTADITLVKAANGQPILSVGVPTGVGITAEGFATPQSASAALADLGLRLGLVDGASNQLINDGNRFFASLDPAAKLVVQVLTLSIPGTTAPGEPIRVTGTTASNVLEAVVIDARGLPSGTVLQVDDIDFVAIVGAVRVIGGAGRNSASGDGAAQYIVLGADDDIIHGGAGNDTVGSKGGDDQIYGDAGDDIVFGGAGNDLLSGGSGSDKLNGGTGFDVALQEGKRSDYSITLDGTGIKLTHIATSVADWLVDVEQVRFETGPTLTVAHSAAEEAAAFLFQQWMGRDLTQAEGAVIQTLDGLSAVQVAELFAQVFPQQAGGKTAQQLLEGMEAAGAIRVDAVRETTFVGDAGDNTITPTLGLAWSVDGGAGTDTLVIPATLAQTHIEASANGFTLQRMTDGAMLELVNVERLTFSDTHLALDLDGHAGQAAKLIGALGGVALLDNQPLVGEVIRALDAGVSAQDLAQLGLQVLDAHTPGQITQLLWSNVVGSTATPAQLQPFISMMAQGMAGGELAVLASNLELNTTRIDLVGLAATGIEFA